MEARECMAEGWRFRNGGLKNTRNVEWGLRKLTLPVTTCAERGNGNIVMNYHSNFLSVLILSRKITHISALRDD